MSNAFYDTIVIMFFTIVPLLLLLLHGFLSSRRRWLWSVVIPLAWTAFGIWMMVAGYNRVKDFSWELLFFFLGGDLILLGLTALIRKMKKKK